MNTPPGTPPRSSASPEERAAGPATGSRLVAGLLLAGAAAAAAVLGLSVWLGVRFGLGPAPPLRAMTGRQATGLVRLLGNLLEGGSGVLLLAAAGAAVAGWGLGLGPADERDADRAAGARLRRLWHDLTALARDAARRARELPQREGGWHVAALGAVVAGGLLLRLLYLSGPVRYDEAFTFTHFASRPLALGLSRYTFPNNHLFHTLLVHLSTALFGTGPVALRLPAFLAGVAVVPAAYLAWSALGDADEALVAAAVSAVAAPLVLYSVNARGYTIVVLCSLLMVPPAARLVRRRDAGALALLCVLAAAALYAIPLALYPVGAVAAWTVLSGRAGADGAEGEGADAEGGTGAHGAGDSARPAGPRRPRSELLRDVGLAVVLVGIAVAWLYLPAVQRSGFAAIVANRFVESSPVGEFLAGVPGFLAEVWATWTAGWPRPVALAVGALGAAGAVREAARWRRTGRASFPLVAVAWSALLLLATRRVSYARIWLFLLPVFGLLVARGFGRGLELVRGAAGDGGAASDEPDSGATDGRDSGEGGPPGAGWAGAGTRARVAAPLAAVLLLGGLGGSVAATGAVPASDATGPYRDGREVSRLLAERMGEGDAVYARGPAEVVLRYWLRHRGVSGDRVNRGPAPGGRLFVVVDHAESQTLADLMARLGVAGNRRIRTRKVGERGRSEVYALLPGR